MDDIDRAGAHIEATEKLLIDATRKKAADIPAGEKGVCAYCDEFSERLVLGNCARCRDYFKLK